MAFTLHVPCLAATKTAPVSLWHYRPAPTASNGRIAKKHS